MSNDDGIERRARLAYLETRHDQAPRRALASVDVVFRGRDFVDQYLDCCAQGTPAQWVESLDKRPQLAFELTRVRALRDAFGLGDRWDDIVSGRFLTVNPFGRSGAGKPATPTPFAHWCADWSIELSGSGDPLFGWHRGSPPNVDPHSFIATWLAAGWTSVIDLWRSFLGQSSDARRAFPKWITLSASELYLPMTRQRGRVRQVVMAAIEPYLRFLAWCVDPYGVGIPREVVIKEFGYAATEPPGLYDDY